MKMLDKIHDAAVTWIYGIILTANNERYACLEISGRAIPLVFYYTKNILKPVTCFKNAVWFANVQLMPNRTERWIKQTYPLNREEAK